MCFCLAAHAAAAAQGVGGIAEVLSGAVRYSTSKAHLETFPTSTSEQAQSKQGKEVVPFIGDMRRKLLSLRERWKCLKPSSIAKRETGRLVLSEGSPQGTSQGPRGVKEVESSSPLLLLPDSMQQRLY